MDIRKPLTQEELDFIAAKFIYNLPKEQINDKRISYHFEKAYFYYLDFCADQQLLSDQKLREKQMESFFKMLVSVLPPQFPKYNALFVNELINRSYRQIPTHGVILFNINSTKILLVKTTQSVKYSFPKGKIRQNQSPEECAYREFKQQVGFNLNYENCSRSLKVDSFGKILYFYIHKIEESNILERKININIKNIMRKGEIDEIKWVDYPDGLDKLILEKKINATTKDVYEELRKQQKSQQYKEKKKLIQNPLEQFKGFSRRVFQ